MISFDVLSFLEGIIATTILINVLSLWMKRRADYTFLGINVRKKRIEKLRKVEAIAYILIFFLLIMSMVYAMLGALPEVVNVKNKSVKGKIYSAEGIKSHYVKVGTVTLEDISGDKIKIKHVYFDNDEIVGQSGEILINSTRIGNGVLMKSDGKYTDFYREHYWPPNVVTEKVKKFLLFYTILSTTFSIWFIRSTVKTFQKETQTIYFLRYKKIKTACVFWIVACIIYKVELVLLLLNICHVNAMKICLTVTYTCYKLGFFLFCVFRYDYVGSKWKGN